jgi:hypothetical protein
MAALRPAEKSATLSLSGDGEGGGCIQRGFVSEGPAGVVQYALERREPGPVPVALQVAEDGVFVPIEYCSDKNRSKHDRVSLIEVGDVRAAPLLPSKLSIHGVPNLSVNMAKRSTQKVSSGAISTLCAISDSAS